MTKYYWPMWPEWLQVYQDQPVRNLAYKGYGAQNIYWNIMNLIDTFTSNDHVMVMWPNNHRITLWYDTEWIEKNDVLGFFPDTNGQLWFTEDTPYMGMYRTHPDFMTSLPNMIIDLFNTIYQTQLLLQSKNIPYTMMFTQNPWIDARPEYQGTNYRATHSDHTYISNFEIDRAKKILKLKPMQSLMTKINWENMKPAVTDPFDPVQFSGIWEYFVSNKEYVMLSHDYDQHCPPLAFHDFTLETILNLDPATGKHRKLATEMSEELINADIPQKFTSDEFVNDVNTETLKEEYKWMQKK